MEIEEFPSHIIEKIKNTWETWNSPPRLSSDSLHLDEIEEMNLTNIQEDEDKKSCIRKIIIKSMIMQAVTHAKDMRRGSNHIHEKIESLSETLFGIQNTVV
ncbi:hypothetical protein Gotur_023916 [Gossypium turneri]